MTLHIRTERLLLRPFRDDDAPALAALAGNLKVARMTARIGHPYTETVARQWIAGHGALRERGEEYPFAVLLADALVGAVGVKRNDAGGYELGYWIGEPWWGRGFATEAAAAIVRFAAETLGAGTLEAGFLYDNPASGRVLAKCGFVRTGEVLQWCEARGQAVKCHRLTLAVAARRADDGSATR
jgi:RimJ/RimL family protein N-acetyltransferase